MVLRMKFLLLVAAILLVLSGCYTTPVRHLTSDIALLKVNQSTEDDVLVFMGEPDEQQQVAAGVEKWLYQAKVQSLLEKAPVIGKRLGSPEYQVVVVTLTNKIVTDLDYSSSDADDLGWRDDFHWQEKNQ